jgi:hypothetical protein
MIQKIDVMDIKTNISVTDAGWTIDNIKTIEFIEGTSSISLELSEPNYLELGQKMFPDGLMPESFEKKLDMLNALIEDLVSIKDSNDHDWELSQARYNGEDDEIYFDVKEVQ